MSVFRASPSGHGTCGIPASPVTICWVEDTRASNVLVGSSGLTLVLTPSPFSQS